MSQKITLRIGREDTEILASRRFISQPDLCFPLESSRREIRNLVRTSSIPTVAVGRSRKAEVEEVTAWMLERNYLLGIEFMRGFCEGRFAMPRTFGMDDRPVWLIHRLDLLRLPRSIEFLDRSGGNRAPKRRICFPQRTEYATSQCCRTLTTSGSRQSFRHSGRLFPTLEPFRKGPVDRAGLADHE